MLIPSLITLLGFVGPAVYLVWRQPKHDYRHFMRTILASMGCFFAGLVITSVIIHLTQSSQPYLNSVGVAVFAYATLAIARWLYQRRH